MALNDYKEMMKASNKYGGSDDGIDYSPTDPNKYSNEDILSVLRNGVKPAPAVPGVIDEPALGAEKEQTAYPNPDLLTSLRDQNEMIQAENPPKLPPIAPAAPPQDVKREVAPEPVPAAPAAPPKVEAPAPMPVLDFGTGGIGSQENLQKALDARDRGQLSANIMSAADLVGAGILGGGAKPIMQEQYQQAYQNASQPVADYQAKLANEKNDPNSPVSQGFKKYMKQLGIEVRGDMSASQAEQIMPVVYKVYNDKLEAASKKELATQAQQAKKEEGAATRTFQGEQRQADRDTKELIASLMGDNKKDAAAEKAKDKLRGRFSKVNQKLVSEIASSRSAFGKGANIVRSTEAIENLVAGRDLNSLDNREVQEVARSLDAVLSQGQPTISGTAKLVPSSAVGDVNKIAEYLLNIRRGAQGKSFLAQMMKTVAREKELAKDQIKRTQGKLLAGDMDLKKADPEAWDQIMEAHGLLNVLGSDTAKTPSREPQSTSLGGADAKVQKYADEHFGGDYEKALKLLQSRGYGK